MTDALTTSLALIFTDAQGQIVFLDNNFLELYATGDTVELIGKPLHTILGCDHDFAQELLQSIARDGYAHEQLITVRKQDNTLSEVAVTGAANYDAQDTFIGVDLMLKYV